MVDMHAVPAATAYLERFCLRSVKVEGKKSGKMRWMREKTSTWPTGVRGMMRMMVKGISVSRSLAVRRSVRTSRGLRVYP